MNNQIHSVASLMDEESSSSCGSVASASPTTTTTPTLQLSHNNNKSKQQQLQSINQSATYPVDKPFFCYVDDKLTKCCKNCKVECRYQIETLLSNHINQQDINKELKEHGHPSSRKIDGRYRLTNEARQELIEHYRYSHGYGLAANGQNYFSYANIDRSLSTGHTRKSNHHQSRTSTVATSSHSNNNASLHVTSNPAPPQVINTVTNSSHVKSTTETSSSPQPVVSTTQIPIPPPISRSQTVVVANNTPPPVIIQRHTTQQQLLLPADTSNTSQTMVRRDQCGEFYESQSTLQLIEHYKYAYGLILEQD